MIYKTNFFIAFLISVLVISPAFSAVSATQEWVKENYYLKKRGEGLSTFTAERMRDLLYETQGVPHNPNYTYVKNPLRTTKKTAFEGINELLEKVDGNDGTEGSAVELETTAQNAYGAINELLTKVDGNDGTGGSAVELETTAQNAYGAINELLTKVDGNDGTGGSAVELETTAQNAYGAINELKGEIDDKVSTTTLQNDYYTKQGVKDYVDEAVNEAFGEDLKTIWDTGANNGSGGRVYVKVVDNFEPDEFLTRINNGETVNN